MHPAPSFPLTPTDHHALVRAATRLLGPAEAEDAVQDAYLRWLEAAPSQVNAAQAWLLTVVRHLAIDRLRRRQWLQSWLQSTEVAEAANSAPSAEDEAAVSQAATQALRAMAAALAPEDGAALLLREVFEIEHADIAKAIGRSEVASRQHLRRALLRWRRLAGAPAARERAPDAGEDAVFRLFAQAIIQRDPRVLWAMLTQPPVQLRSMSPRDEARAPISLSALTARGGASCGVMQVGGALGLVLTLDGVTLCVLPLGVSADERAGEPDAVSC